MSIDWSKVEVGTPVLYTTTYNWSRAYDITFHELDGRYLIVKARLTVTGKVYTCSIPVEHAILDREILFKETM